MTGPACGRRDLRLREKGWSNQRAPRAMPQHHAAVDPDQALGLCMKCMSIRHTNLILRGGPDDT